MIEKDPRTNVVALPCWRHSVDPQPLTGGITNLNYTVEDGDQKFFVRVGEDIPVHQIMRFNELAASYAAHAAGVSPRVHFASDGILVLDFIEGQTLGEEEVRDPTRLPDIVDLVIRCHREVPKHWRGPALYFSVFQVIRGYAATLSEGNTRLIAEIPRYVKISEQLAECVGPAEIVFGHNDLLPANFIDDGQRIWLIDYDYAGFGNPLFDLGGLAANNALSEEQEYWMLEHYFETTPTPLMIRRYRAMKCASLLRESMWSMVSEEHSTLDVDYVAYTTENLARFESALSDFEQL